MWCFVGLPVDSQSYESLEKENSQLRGENKALRSEHNTLTFEKEALRSENDSLRSDNDMLMKENKAQTRESKRMHDKAGQHQLMVTTLRHRPVQVSIFIGVSYHDSDRHTVAWC